MVPTGTDEIPILSRFLVALTMMISWSVVITIIAIKVKFEDQLTKPPAWIYIPLVNYFGKLINIEKTFEIRCLEWQKQITRIRSRRARKMSSISLTRLDSETSECGIHGEEKVA